MQHPTSQQCYAVADTLESAIRLYPGLQLDMTEYQVNDGHECGTVHCHGGVYALMKCNLSSPINYRSGSIHLANDLGFRSVADLEEWAELNPRLWGNKKGIKMFFDPDAFYSHKRPHGAESVQEIADHWREVGNRLKKLETNYRAKTI